MQKSGFLTSRLKWAMWWENLSFCISDLVRYKPVCATKEDGLRLYILNLRKRGISIRRRLFFNLNSAEHEILTAHNYWKYPKSMENSGLGHRSQSFILLINVKMPTIVGILTFMSRINSDLSWVEHEKSFITSGPAFVSPYSKIRFSHDAAHMSRRDVRKSDFCICENKDAKLISAFVFATCIVQYLCFPNPKFQVSSHLLWLYSPVCVEPGRKPRSGFLTSRLISIMIELNVCMEWNALQ